MLQLSSLSKQFGGKILFEKAEAHIGERSRVALIGPNGAGKSTLIKMILGFEAPDEGAVTRISQLRIGYLAQEVPKTSDRSVLEETMRLDGRREELLTAKDKLELKFADGESKVSDLERYGRILEELENLDEYSLESRAKTILSGMGFKEGDYNRLLTEFSGGWLMRVALSRILLIDPDLLLLDEPTNHLDLESQLWLEEFLSNYHGAMILISHDTAFLNRMVNEVLEIDQKRLWTYSGNLESYAVQKEERLTLLRSQHAGQQNKIAELEGFIRRFGAKATKAKQAQSRQKQLDKMDRIELPDDRAQVNFRFPPVPHCGKDVLIVKNAAMNFAEKKVFRDLNWIIPRGSRTAIVGVNGAGKTTLLRLLAQQLAATAGEVRLGHEVKIGYYAQMQAEALNPQKTILQELEYVAPDMAVSKVRGIAGAFLFSGDAVEKKCSVLSGGEKARVALAKLLLAPANFLLLDEPTNHLDVESREVLLEALQDYTGTLCLVSHDRSFISPLVDNVLEIIPGPNGSQVIPLLGGYEDYLARKMNEAADTVAKSDPSKKSASVVKEKPSGPSNNKKRGWEKEKADVERSIAKLEEKQKDVHQSLSDSSTYDDPKKTLELVEKQKVIGEELSTKYTRWEELSLLLESTS